MYKYFSILYNYIDNKYNQPASLDINRVDQVFVDGVYANENGINIHYPPLVLCTDNAAMIAARGYFEYKKGNFVKSDLNAIATKNM